MSVEQLRFMQVIESARNRVAADGVDTMLVHGHLSQLTLFMLRGGIEFFARQDSFGQRRDFIRRVVEYNRLLGRLEAIADNFLIDGSGLLYFRPSGDLYRVHYFPKDQYRTYYDEEGELEEVQIIYSFKVKPNRGMGMASGFDTSRMASRGFFHMEGQPGELRWVRLRIRMDTVEQTVCTQRPDFDLDGPLAGRTQSLVNSLAMIPAVEVFNNCGLNGASGSGEFDWLSSHIMAHDRMRRSIRENLRFFGNPTLVSSRPRHDLLEPDSAGDDKRPTMASKSGFISMTQGSTRVSDPLSLDGGGFRVPRIIANVEAADRVGYIVPDAVSGDLTNYAQRYEESIRAALGGVDDLSISSGATAYEVRTLYGRVQATARRKCRDLFDYGFCKLFQMMIQHEETLFRESLGQALQIQKPAPILPETMPGVTPEQIDKLEQRYADELGTWHKQIAEATEGIKETGNIPPGVVGLIPDGSLLVEWRWMGEVFEDSPQEILQNSIVVRNLQELGVGSIDALQYLFPRKTPEERAAMLGGIPFRVTEATQRTLGIFLDMVRGLFQVPHPQEPDLPLAADPSLDLTPFILRTLDFLRREMSYSATYHDADPAVLTPVLGDADRLRATRGEPTGRDRFRDEQRRRAFRAALDRGYAAGAGSPGDAYTAQLGFGAATLGAGVPAAGGRRSDADAGGIGLAGGILAFDPERPDSWAGPELGTGAWSLGAPDLMAPTNAGVPIGGPAGTGGAGGAGNAAGAAGPAARRRPANGRTAGGAAARAR